MNEKERQKISEALFSTNENIVIKALEIVEISGDAKLFYFVLELFNMSNNENIKAKIINIINNVKDNNIIPVMINALSKIQYTNSLYTLISSCWMSGLNYGNYIDVFTDIFIKKDFLTAFEAFTLIENTERKNIPLPVLEKSYHELLMAKKNIHIEKQQLCNELINVFENMIQK